MSDSFLVILSGPPGAGKTTVGRLVAETFDRSAVVQSDFFWASIAGGLIQPWEPEATVQNRLMLRMALDTTIRFLEAGYVTVLEGIIRPGFFDLFREELAKVSVAIHYVVLRPTIDVCLVRSVERTKEPQHAGALTLEDPIRHVYEGFERLDAYEKNVLDNSTLSVEATVASIVELLRTSSDSVIAP